MKILCILFLFLIVFCGYTQASPKFSFTGNTDYTQQKEKTLIQTLGTETRINIYEHPNKKFLIYYGGSTNINYNVFMGNYRADVFGILGIEF